MAVETVVGEKSVRMSLVPNLLSTKCSRELEGNSIKNIPTRQDALETGIENRTETTKATQPNQSSNVLKKSALRFRSPRGK
jgi:hypothetical protein